MSAAKPKQDGDSQRLPVWFIGPEPEDSDDVDDDASISLPAACGYALAVAAVVGLFAAGMAGAVKFISGWVLS